MNFPVNPISIATKDQANSALHVGLSLSQHLIDSMSQLVYCNLAASKRTLTDSVRLAQNMLDSESTNQVYEVIHQEVQPAISKVASYGRYVARLGIETQSRVTEVIHARVVDTSNQIHTLVTDLAKVTPMGTDRYAEGVGTGLSTWQKIVEKIAESQISMLKNYAAHLDSYGEHKTSNPTSQPGKSKKSAKPEEVDA